LDNNLFPQVTRKNIEDVSDSPMWTETDFYQPLNGL